MNSLWLLTKKNLTLLLRAKSSSLIVFLGPLLIILVLGLAYNTSSQYGLNIGIYAPTFSADVNSVITLLQEQEFRVVKYESSIDDCVEDIKVGAIHTCLSLPESLQVAGNTPKEVTFYLDSSRINVVWMIQQTLQSKFNFKAQEISQGLTQDLLTRISETKATLAERENDLTIIKDKSSSASSSAQSAKSTLAGVDLSVSSANYDLSLLSAFKINLSGEINAGLGQIAEARAALTSINMSSPDRATVDTLLGTADTQLSVALALVTGSGDISLDKVSSLLESLQIDLQNTNTKLTTAAGSVSTSGSNLDTVAASLSESLSAVETLQAALTTMKSNLDSLKVTEAGTITAPLITKIEKVSKESTYLNYTFPTLLVLVVMFTSLLLGTILVMMEKNSPAFVRNYFLPIKKTTFVISIYLTTLALVLVQIIIILLISWFFLPGITAVLPAMALILFLAASVFTFLGMAIGYAFTSEETGVLASISAGSVLLFFSGVVLPLETISPQLREFTFYSPFVLAEKMIRQIFIFGSALETVWLDMLFLVAYVVLLFLIILIIESVLHRHLVHKFMAHHHQLHREQDKMNKNEV